MMGQPAEQVPIPCGRCGGPMRETGPAALVGPVQVTCPFCHATEVLPEQQAQRVMALRARLAHLRAAQLAEEGPALAFAQVVQTLRSQIWMYVAFGALLIGGSLSGAITQIQAAVSLRNIPASAREEILASATFPALSIGIFLGVATGYVLALLKFKKAIEPTLRARAPLQPGMPARCRSCGASLPMGPATGAFVSCPHCAASNLLTPELARDRARLLEEETRTYNERAQGVSLRAQRASVTFQQYFYLGGGIGVGLALALSFLLRLAIAALLF